MSAYHFGYDGPAVRPPFNPGHPILSPQPQRQVDPIQQLIQHLIGNLPVQGNPLPGGINPPGGVNPGGPMQPYLPQGGFDPSGAVGTISGAGGPQGGGYRPADIERAAGNDNQAAQTWEAHHPGAVSRNQIPMWVTAGLNGPDRGAPPAPAVQGHTYPGGLHPAVGPGGPRLDGNGMQPGANVANLLHDVLNHHRASNGLAAMHPDEIHQRVANLAREITTGRQGRVSKALKRLRPTPAAIPPHGGPQAY